MSLEIDFRPIISAHQEFEGRADMGAQVSVTRSGLRCSVTQLGLTTYRGNETMFIILRQQVRNLRWYSSAPWDEAPSCSAGTVFIIPASTDLSINWSASVEIIIGHLDGRVLQDVLLESSIFRRVEENRSVLRSSCKECLPISHMIWDEVFQRDGYNKSYLNALSLVLMHTIARSVLSDHVLIENKAGLSKLACQQIEIYLNQNFRKSLSVPDMASFLGISAGHFSTCFRASFGQTPHQYLLGLRLDEAQRCLKETSMPISEIARLLNFSSQSHLTTALRKHRQMTPGELRK
ncbi:helix-turn-helix transcriptional regulator [Brucella oryzae]|uniref:helix-turn-helix transcriptional regulator n=1 Tax=Brucella oryzae TaxID=335286 RepID=UPI002011BE39|nr:AraC family transcriptional regulator [Brucella oryzae]